jgi:hypothetical protein
MTLDPNTLVVTHLSDKNRFELTVNGHTAVLNYTRQNDDTLVFTHTGVPRALEGQGVGSRLVKDALDYARANNFKVVPLCWFVVQYIDRHPEYRQATL